MADVTTDAQKYLDQFHGLIQRLGKEDPDFAGALMEFVKQAEKPGALTTKTKELISVALGVAACCPFCIAFHVKNAIAEGATKKEILESCLVAALMGGGPAIAYIRYAVDACDQFGAK
ncbi:MAG: carboxymuconolactone decarboxylase family protein [Caldisericaceae bacterium]|nr:carboxymuconolactone decarboxylase family protein [Caldisericaceae bacterium]